MLHENKFKKIKCTNKEPMKKSLLETVKGLDKNLPKSDWTFMYRKEKDCCQKRNLGKPNSKIR